MSGPRLVLPKALAWSISAVDRDTRRSISLRLLGHAVKYSPSSGLCGSWNTRGLSVSVRGFTNVRVLEADLTGDIAFPHQFDTLWCRWVASFVTDLPRLVGHVSSALRPGGHAIFHEYVNYATWRTIPHVPALEAFVTEVMASWRDAGGEPDIATALLPALSSAGFEIVDTTPIIFAVNPAHFAWQWLRAFIVSNLKRLVESGRITEAWAVQAQHDFTVFEQSPNSLLDYYQ